MVSQECNSANFQGCDYGKFVSVCTSGCTMWCKIDYTISIYKHARIHVLLAAIANCSWQCPSEIRYALLVYADYKSVLLWVESRFW